MNISAVILRWFGRCGGFTTFETAVIYAVMEFLPPEERDRLAVRIKQINLVQRLDGGREVNAYSMHGGRPTYSPETRIRDEVGETQLVSFAVEGPTCTANSGTVWLVDGHFFSLEFDKPTEHADDKEIIAIRVEDRSVSE